MLVRDPLFTGGAQQWIEERRYNAEWALAAQLEVLGRQFDDMEDDYLRERKADIEQVVERLLRQMTAAAGKGGPAAANTLAGARDFGGADPLVLVASDVAPADMLHFKRSVFTGFVTDVGGRTSHTAIVARSTRSATCSMSALRSRR
jgi:phosphotransferase system enzyme I (PtsI)